MKVDNEEEPQFSDASSEHDMFLNPTIDNKRNGLEMQAKVLMLLMLHL